MLFPVTIMTLISFFLNFFSEFPGVGFGKPTCHESNFFTHRIINRIFSLSPVHSNLGIIMSACFTFSGDDFVRKFISPVD